MSTTVKMCHLAALFLTPSALFTPHDFSPITRNPSFLLLLNVVDEKHQPAHCCHTFPVDIHLSFL